MLMTAKLSSTYTDTTDYLSLISDTYLSKFYSCLKYSRQILYKLTEINSSIRLIIRLIRADSL